MIRKSNLPKWLKNSLNIVRLSIGSLFIILSFSFVGSSADDTSPKAPATATFLSGQDFNNVIASFVHVSDIVRFTRKDDCGTTRNIVSTRDSQNPIYVIDDGRGTVYYCTRADVLYLNPDSSGMFSGRVRLEKIDMNGWDTSNVTDMSHMLAGCNSLLDLDLSSFDTSSVRDMSHMFAGCSSLPQLDLRSFDTRNVIDMSHMFAGCSSLPDLDLSSFDTRSVTDMSNMFQGCSGLIKVNISRFDTSNVTNMSHMFAGCSSLPDLDLRSFDTSNVTDMSNMFQGCSGLIKVIISRFDTSNVRDMSYMFAGCISLSDLDLSSFNTRSVRDMSSMFYGDSGFKTLKLSNFDTSSVTDMSHMFQGCSGLDYLDISRFDTRNVSDMNEMFSYAKNLKYLDLRSFDTRNVTDMSSMFYGNNNLKRIYATNAFITTNVHASSGQNMFTSNTLLMGGSGTMYNPNHTDKSYAKIDGGTQNPGYFTLNEESPSILVGSTSRTDVNSSTQVVIDLNLVAYGINTGDFTISDLIFKIGDNTINPTTRTLTYDYSSGSDNYYKLTLDGLSGNGNLSVIVKTGAISDYLGTTSAYTEFNNILTVDNIPPECVVTQQPTNILLKDGDSGSFTMKCTSTGSRIKGTATHVDETAIEYDPDVVDLGINFSSMTTEGISEVIYYFDYFALGDGTTTFQLKENMISDNAGNYNTSSPLTDPVTVDMTAPTVSIFSDGSGTCTTGNIYTVTGIFSEAVTGINASTLTVINGVVQDFHMISDTVAVWTVNSRRNWTDLNGNEFSWKDLTICDPSDTTKCLTVMDRNLGATKAGTGCTESDTGACGYHYQWGNNYGFVNPGRNGSDSITSSSTNTLVAWSGVYNHVGYFGSIFVKGIDATMFDYWQGGLHHDGLRGGENDSANNWGLSSPNPMAWRKGPCPDGYHVPSIGEWGKLLKYWVDSYTGMTSTTITLNGTYPLQYFSNSTAKTQFVEDFKIPFAGYRQDSTAKLLTVRPSSDYTAHFWTSSPATNGRSIYRILVNSSNVDAHGNGLRAYGLSLRCFKNSTYLNPDLSSDVGVVRVTIETGAVIDLAGNTNTTGSNIISWDYDQAGPTGSIDVKYNGNDNTALGTILNLNLSAQDEGCNNTVMMQFSCDGNNRSTAEPFVSTKNFLLSYYTGAGCTTTNGTKTIYVRYIDGLGNTGGVYSDSITLNNLDIVIQASSTAANKTLKINKYFSNSYMVDRGDGVLGNVNTDKTHTYSASGTYNITLLLTGGATRWSFNECTEKPLIPISGTTMGGVAIIYMPSLAKGFGTSSTNPGNCFFRFFNRQGAITRLPEGSFTFSTGMHTVGDSFFSLFNAGGRLTSLPSGSFDTSYITNVGYGFFAWFNWGGRLTSLPDGSFNISQILGTVDDYFFSYFNNNGKLTSLPSGSFDTSSIMRAGSNFFSYFNYQGEIAELPSGSFNISNIIKVGDAAFSNFNFDGNITNLPTGSFDTSSIITVGNSFFSYFNQKGALTSLPAGSFTFTGGLKTVGDNFFSNFNYIGKITSLPSGSFNISNIRSAGNSFFSYFNFQGKITSLPSGSFNTSNIRSAGNSFFSYFNFQGKITSLPTNSFNISNLTGVGSNFFSYFNYGGSMTSLPAGSFNTSNITTAGSNFFAYFNKLGNITNLPASFTMSSVGASVSSGYRESFVSSYTLTKNVSELLSGVMAPSDDRNTFSDNQPGRCGVDPNWLVTTADACSITYNSNGGSTITNPTKKYTANTTGVVAGAGVTTPTKTNFAFNGWYTDPEGGTLVETVSFPSMDSGTLYAHWREAVPPTVTISSEGSGMCAASGTVYIVTGSFSEAVTGIDASTLTVNGGTVQDFHMISDTVAVWIVSAGGNGGGNDIVHDLGSGIIVTYYPDANVSYTLNSGFDTEGDFTAGLITITDGNETYTIMDRNLGATAAGTWCEDPNWGDACAGGDPTYGYYFQWGNNYGFPSDPNASITTSSTQVDANGYGPGNYYSSNTFITSNPWNSSANDNLRGGVSGTYEAMQGPCPNGYHVPSSGEWLGLSTMLGYPSNKSQAINNLRNELYLPFAGLRSYSSAGVYGQDTDAYYWSSIAYSAGNAYLLNFGSAVLRPGELGHSHGFSVRCFRNPATDSSSSIVTVSIETGAFEDLAGNTNTTGSNTISWEYDAQGPTGSIDVKYNGNDNYASGTTLNLTLDAQDLGCNNTVSKMQFSCDGTSWSTLENFVSSKNFSLSNYSSVGCTTADGEKTIYVRYVDGLGNTGESYSDTITVDLVRPEEPRCAPVSACFSGSSPTITCSTTSSDGIVRYTTNGNTPTCSSSVWSDHSFSATTTLKVIACDPAGNYSSVTGYTYTKDTTAPRVPVMTIEPTYTQGLSNIVTSTEVRDVGCAGKVEYQFCMKSESRLMSGGEINSILQDLSVDGIDGIERTGAIPSKSPKIVELGQSQGEVQAWYEKGIIYIYTKGDILKFPEDSSSMFANMDKLQSINLGDIDTSNVKNMSRMFSNCKSLQKLDLGRFDTSNVTNMTEMFAGDGELKTIYASDSFVIGNKIKSDNMFLNCSSIVGGVGTTYDDKYIDATYARIDSKKLPGYFTRSKTKEDTQKAPSSDDGFGCDQVTDWLSERKTVFENLNDGQTYIYFVRSRDKLGNTSAWSSGTSSTQDNTAPVVSLDGNGTPRFANSGTTITIYIKVTDIISGINTGDFAVGDLTFKVGNTSVTPSTKTLTWQSTSNGENLYKLVLRGVTGNGTLTMISAANAIADRVGNNSVTTTLTPNVVIDNINPICNLTQNPSSGTWTSGDVTLTATVTETNPDKYSWTGWNNLLTTFTTYTTGSNGIRTFYVQDKAGNRGTCEITINNIDKTAPDTPICTTNACYSGSQAVTCNTSSSDGTIRYTTNGNTPTCSSNVRSDQSFSATTTLKVIACDPAGNYSSVTGYTYTKDNTAPTFTFANNSGAECAAGTLTITNASDGTGCAGLHASAYKFGGGSWGTTISTSIAARQPGSVTVTGYVRDSLGNETSKTARYTFNDVAPTAIDFSVDGVGTGKTVNWKMLSSATEGLCGSGNLSASVVSRIDTPMGSCTVSGDYITFVATGGANGTATCVITIMDNEHSTKDITVTWNDISRPIPQISFANSTPSHNAVVTQNRFTTKMDITNIDGIQSFEYEYNNTPYDLMSGLVLMYNFDNVASLGESTSLVKDLSQYGRNGVVHGATWVNNGVHGGAYSFNGTTSNYIDFPSYGALNTNGTISLWVKGSLPTSSTIVMGNYNGLAVGFGSAGSLIGSTSGLGNKARGTMNGYNNSGWNHIVVSINNGTIAYYVNGIKLTNGTTTSWTRTNGSGRIGRRNNDTSPYPYSGLVDEIRVYNRALSQNEVQFLYKSNLKKTSGNTWEFETINTCLDMSGTYNYTGKVVSYVDTQATTGRRLTTNISDVSVDSTGYDFGTHTASGSQQVLRGTMGTLTVTDKLGKSGWKVYLTTSPTLVGETTHQTIDTNNLKFKATNLIYSGLYDGVLNTHVTLGNGMSTSQYHTAHGNAETDNILEYIVRTGDVDDFMCGDVGIYSDNTQIELTVPAWQIQDTYTGTLWVTLQQN